MSRSYTKGFSDERCHTDCNKAFRAKERHILNKQLKNIEEDFPHLIKKQEGSDLWYTSGDDYRYSYGISQVRRETFATIREIFNEYNYERREFLDGVKDIRNGKHYRATWNGIMFLSYPPIVKIFRESVEDPFIVLENISSELWEKYFTRFIRLFHKK
jgi:hypothetical protein